MKDSIVPTPQGVLFDMDGVLLLETQRSSQSWQIVCRQFASLLDLPEAPLIHAVDESRLRYQESLEGNQNQEKQRRDRLEPFATRQEMVEQALQAIGKADREIAAEMVRAYETLREEHRQLAPGAEEVLRYFQDRAIPLALLSNGNATYQRGKIQRHHLAPFFKVIVIEEEFGAAKPDPRVFVHALDHLRVDPQQAWMVGDHLAFDIAGAQQLGIFAFWCDFRGQGLPEPSPTQPDRIIHSLEELRECYEVSSHFSSPLQ